MFDSQDRKIDFGLLIMRLGLTAALFLYALPKLFAGAHARENIGFNTLMLWSLGLAVVFLGLIYVGPGRYSIAVKLEKK